MFPAKKRKVEEISPLHPALVSLPSPSLRAHRENHSAKKTDAYSYLMGEPMNSETETESGENFGMEHPASPTKSSSSSLDRFRYLPAPTMIIEGGDEVEEEEIAPNHPVFATSNEGGSRKVMPVSESVFGMLTCDISYRKSTPLALPSPSSETRDMEFEVVKETSTSQGLTPEFSMLQPPLVQRKAISPDQTAPRQSQATNVASVPDQFSVELQTNSPSSMPPATTVAAASGPIHIQTSVLCDENLKCELLSICNENSERILQHIEAYICQSQVYKEVARLKEELENIRSEKSAAFERARVLEVRLQEQTERLQSESERSQGIEAARLKLLREYEELARLKECEMCQKDQEMTSLKYYNTMIEKRTIESEQRNTVLEDRIDHVNRLLEEEKMNSRILNEELVEAVHENNKLMTELKIYDDALATIQGYIRVEITETLSQLKERIDEQTERHRSESKRLQEIESAWRELLQGYKELARLKESAMSEKDDELTNLKHNNTMIEKRNIDVERRNTVLEDQINHVNRLLEAENFKSRKLNEQLGEKEEENSKLTTELKTYNDGLAKIQGCIRRSLIARLSRLKETSTTIKHGHYEDLLARINALGRVNEPLHKMLETIEIATSMSAYSPAAAIFVRLRAYHGDDFDLQRLVLPLHLNRQDYARIRNAVDPLAAQVAQKYEICKH